MGLPHPRTEATGQHAQAAGDHGGLLPKQTEASGSPWTLPHMWPLCLSPGSPLVSSKALQERRARCETQNTDPVVWTNQRVLKWVRDIDLKVRK